MNIWVFLYITGCALIVGAGLYAMLNVNYIYAWWKKRHIPRTRGPWCVVIQRVPFGHQILFQSKTQRPAVKWRIRNRTEVDLLPMHLMTRDEVDRRNAEWMATEEWWSLADMLAPHFNEALARGWWAVGGQKEILPPTESITVIPAWQTREMKRRLDALIVDAQMVADGLRTMRRAADVPEEMVAIQS